MQWLPWLRWSSLNLFLYSAVQMYEINMFITSDLNELRNSNQTDWISLACDQAHQFWRTKRPAREQASSEAAFPFVWGFRVTSRDSPIHFVIVRWRHAREQPSGEAAFPFVWGFRVTFSWLSRTLRYSSLATRKRTSERWSCPSCEVFAWLLRDSPIHLVTVRCPLRPGRDLKTISNH